MTSLYNYRQGSMQAMRVQLFKYRTDQKMTDTGTIFEHFFKAIRS